MGAGFFHGICLFLAGAAWHRHCMLVPSVAAMASKACFDDSSWACCGEATKGQQAIITLVIMIITTYYNYNNNILLLL
jgi:hypothetical protein